MVIILILVYLIIFLYRRIKKAVFNLGGMVTKYIRFYSVLPGMDKKEFDSHMDRVRKLARSWWA